MTRRETWRAIAGFRPGRFFPCDDGAVFDVMNWRLIYAWGKIGADARAGHYLQRVGRLDFYLFRTPRSGVPGSRPWKWYVVRKRDGLIYAGPFNWRWLADNAREGIERAETWSTGENEKIGAATTWILNCADRMLRWMRRLIVRMKKFARSGGRSDGSDTGARR